MILRRLKEAFIGEKRGDTKLVSYYSEPDGEAPEISFKQLIDYHNKTPQIQIAVSSYAEMITGTNIQINADDEKAKKLIEEWNRKNNFYDKFEGVVNTTLICGASMFEKLDENLLEDIIEVDMKSIKKKKRNVYGETEFYEHETDNGQIVRIDPKKIIEFNLTSFSRSAWGNSLFYPLVVSRRVGNRTTRPLVEQMWAIEDAMSANLLNYSFPLEYHVFEGANDEQLEKEAVKLRSYKPGDKFIVSREPKVIQPDRKQPPRFDAEIRHIEKVFELGTQFPHDILTGDFTSRASSETTENIVLKRVRGYQRYLANKLKTELYDPILSQNGIDPITANLSVSFTAQNIVHLNPDQMLANANANKVSVWEYREWLKANTGIDLFDDDGIQTNIDQKQQIIQQKTNNFKQSQNQESLLARYRLIEKRAREIKKEYKKKCK